MALRPLHIRGHGVVREEFDPTCEPIHTLCTVSNRVDIAWLPCHGEKALMKPGSVSSVGKKG